MAKQDRTRKRSTVARALNDLGLATWFGGSLMGAVGLNGAADATARPAEVANAGWNRWSAVNAAAVAAYAVGGTLVTWDNKARIGAQAGVGSAAALKAVLTGTALAATVAARLLGERAAQGEAAGADTAGPSEPTAQTPDDVASAQRRLKVLQWAVPALTGAALVVDSRLSEQQRPHEVALGVLRRLNPAA